MDKNSIIFHVTDEKKLAEEQGNSQFTVTNPPVIEVLRISAEGITANPDIPVDDAARAVLDALAQYFTPEVWEIINKGREKNNG